MDVLVDWVLFNTRENKALDWDLRLTGDLRWARTYPRDKAVNTWRQLNEQDRRDFWVMDYDEAKRRLAANGEHLMVPFRVDIRKVRTSIFKTRKDDEIAWIGRLVVNGYLYEDDPFFDPKDAMESALAEAARRNDASIGQPTLQPHPWKRPDGTLIKAEWEE